MIQDAGLFPHFTVERNIGLVPKIEGWPEAEDPGSRARAYAIGGATCRKWLPAIRISCLEGNVSE